MIKVYILPVQTINNTLAVVGLEYIFNACLTYDADKATLIQDTTPEQDVALSALATLVREPTPQEIASLPPPPTPEELALAEEIALCEGYLSQSAPAITMPQIWAVLRCLAKHLGFQFEDETD